MYLMSLLLIPTLAWAFSVNNFELTPVGGARILKTVERHTLSQCCVSCNQDCGGILFNNETKECQQLGPFKYPSNESTTEIMVIQQLLPDIDPRNNPDGLLVTAMGADDNSGSLTVTDLYDDGNICQDYGTGPGNVYGSSLGMLNNSYPVICGGYGSMGHQKYCKVYGFDGRKLPFTKTFWYG